MSGLELIRVNPNLEIQREQISETDFCVVVDDFLKDPQALIDYAAENPDKFDEPELAYPGLMMDLDPGVLRDFTRFVLTPMRHTFGFLRGSASLATGLSMVTLEPSQLSNYQRLCHTDPRDTMGRRKFASLVYLFENEELGGTAFYRWKEPEIVVHGMALEYREAGSADDFLAEHSEVFRQPPCFMTDSNDLAELLHVVPPRFNRLVFYSGEIPHTPFIRRPELITRDFRRGRLTLNSFISAFPK